MAELVFCLPFAGGGASFYRAWTAERHDRDWLRPVQLPGREEFFDLPCAVSVQEAAAFATQQVLDGSSPSDRITLFGHSFGAIVAYEVAHNLVRQGRQVERLVASGSVDPTVGVARRSAGLTDEEFVDQVERIAGYRHPALQNPQLWEVLLPTLRNDVESHEAYLAQPGLRLPVPITAVRGAADQLITAQDLRGWARVTTEAYDQLELPGGHMYLAGDPQPLVDLLHPSTRQPA